jgi:hypothetical protein
VQMGDIGCPLCVPLYVSYKVAGHELSVDQWKQQNGYRCLSNSPHLIHQQLAALVYITALFCIDLQISKLDSTPGTN